MSKLLYVKSLYAQLEYCPKPPSQRLLQYTDGLINLGPGTPRNILIQVIVVENFLTSFTKARNLVTTNVTVKMEDTVDNTRS